MTLSIDAAFDGGNISVVAIDGDRVDLEIRRDRYSSFYQWFSFRLAGARGRNVTLRIVNAGARRSRAAGRATRCAPARIGSPGA